jgi:glycosyltransferase involved in cell wall biosynthesis
MKIAYVTTYDARSADGFSGTGHFMARSLESAGLSVDLIGPLEPRRPLLVNAKRAWYRLVTKTYFEWTRDPTMARRYASDVARRLTGGGYDVVFSPGTVPVAYLEDAPPIVTWADATFRSLLGFYPDFDPDVLAPESVEAGFALEARAIERASINLYCSDWAAESALRDFDAEPSTVEVVPYGANLPSLVAEGVASEAIDRRPKEPCRLLFIGIDWKRKGATTAIAVAAALNRVGLRTELIIVGSEPPVPPEARDFVHVRGFVDKDRGGDSAIADLLTAAHFLILPTRAETFGLVLCEANAYGVPCLTTRVGGVPTVVRDGVNGKLFDADAPVNAYVAEVVRLFDDYDAYRQLAANAYQEYRQRLNWETSGARVRALLESL